MRFSPRPIKAADPAAAMGGLALRTRSEPFASTGSQWRSGGAVSPFSLWDGAPRPWRAPAANCQATGLAVCQADRRIASLAGGERVAPGGLEVVQEGQHRQGSGGPRRSTAPERRRAMPLPYRVTWSSLPDPGLLDQARDMVAGEARKRLGDVHEGRHLHQS